VTWLFLGGLLYAAPTELVDEAPVDIKPLPSGTVLVDFGRVAFGNVRLKPPAKASGALTVHFGEASAGGRINRKPPGTVRYNKTTVLVDVTDVYVVAPPADKRNTDTTSTRHPPAILTPKDWGVVLPFRWVEIEGWKGEFRPEFITRQSIFAKGWDDDAAAFECSDPMLNRIWELCRYSIKATTFAGVYVDGDRERIPYEADAYLNQLSHYYTDHGSDVQVARDTIDHLMKYGTWPTEWAPHMVFMVHADWMRTGDTQWMAGRYEALKSKTLADRKAADGLIASNAQQVKKTDIVDWPRGERDGYVFTDRNTVVNAFYLRATAQMGEMARVLGKADEADAFESSVRVGLKKFQEAFFDAEAGLYRDGAKTEHRSLHANLFPLAFGLVPEARREHVADWLAGRGMACSVYAAQYLMEALFENGADEEAIRIMTAKNDRSWRHMVESGTTISWEAWDMKYKPNQDWNHAWGAAPGNILPRYVLGVQPLKPGWKTVVVRPCLGGLSYATGKVPTQLGPILVDWTMKDSLRLKLNLPDGMKARVELPAQESSQGIWKDGKRVKATRVANRWVLDELVAAGCELEVR